LWSIFFKDGAPFEWDSVKQHAEASYHKKGNWQESDLDNFYGRKVLAERNHIFNSHFDGYLASFSVMTKYFFEMQTAYLLEKSENAIVI